MEKKKKKLTSSFKYAFCGIVSAFKTEKNMKIHALMILLVIIAGIYLNISKMDWIICIILFGLVVFSELMNTAIETVTDLAMPDINPKAKLTKDISAGAVLIIALVSAIIGLIIFIPKIVELLQFWTCYSTK